jgi:glutamate-1-semialdehyde aminotransferase
MNEKLTLDESNRLYKEAMELIPGGVLGVLRPYNYIPKEYPIFFKTAKGGRVTDVDGNEYIDLMATFGAIVIGHAVDELDNAVVEEIRRGGFCTTLAQPVQNDLARKLRELIPSCDKSILVKTGSDGTAAAIRIARAHTGRTKILRCGYHGWHDWSVDVKAGVPDGAYSDVVPFQYNDLDEVADLLKQHDNGVAAIITWPIHTPLGKPVEMPKPGYLEGLRALADQHGAVLIFDELRTAFRVDLGGAQRMLGVTPDMTVIGKAMANGYAIAAVVGTEKIMKTAGAKVFISSTYFQNSFAQVAALKTIEILERDDVIGVLRRKGERCIQRLAQVVKDSGVNCTVSGEAWMPHFTFNEATEMLNMKTRFRFYTHLIRAGVFLSPFHHGFFIYEHTDADLDRVVTTVAEAMDEIRREQRS